MPPSGGAPIRVVVTDNHPLVLSGLDQLFAQHNDLAMVARCTDAGGTLRAVREHRPDVLVLDIRLPDDDGFSVLNELKRERLPVRTVILTAGLDEDDILRAMRLGVAGIVLKDMSAHLLVLCIRKVHTGKRWIERDAISRAMDKVLSREATTRELSALLTNRELEIVELVARGLRNKAVADALHISEGTVKVHLHHIYEKLHVDGRMGLIVAVRDRASSEAMPSVSALLPPAFHSS